MNNVKNKLFASLLIVSMVLGVIPLVIAHSPAPVFWIEPQTGIIATDMSPFNVTVWVENTGLSYTWQVKVSFNATQLKCNKAGYTAGGTSQFFAGHGTVPVTPAIDNVGGSVVHGESLVGADSRAAGSGSLFWIEFEPILSPPVAGSLDSIINTSSGDTFLLDPDLNQVTTAMDHITYSFPYASPTTNPRLAIDPSLVVKSKDFLWVGTTFTVDVNINTLEAGWFLGNVSTHLSYNSALLDVTSVTFDPLWTTTSFDDTVSGNLGLFAATGVSPSGTVKIATVEFTILAQGMVPPDPAGSHLDSPLTFNGYALYSTTYNYVIPTNAPINGLVQVFAYMPTAPPHLEVSSVTMGPGPVLGQLFNVTVTLVDAADIFNMIGVQFRLAYPAALVEPVATYEGPFLPSFAALQPGSMGTFYQSYFETLPEPHVLVGDMIFPDEFGVWHPPMLDGTGVVSIITFRVIYQSFGDPDQCGLFHIYEQLAIGLDNLQDQNVVDLLLDPPVDGTYCITTNLPGRSIDVYGFAVNSGLIEPDWQQILQFVPPYGGQGQDVNMDMVEEQSWVWLHANVTYNYWPVQHKMVGFEIIQPDGMVYGNLFAYTDDNGVATVGFRMPWPCQNPEALIGKWNITASVQLADEFIFDHLRFQYDYLVHIWKVTTDKYEYGHGETVKICIEYGSQAQQYYPFLLKVHIQDELGVIFSAVPIETTIGGAVFCSYNNFTTCVTIWIPKWAYAGIATIHVNAFSAEPSQGGAPIGPEYVGPTIAIQPW